MAKKTTYWWNKWTAGAIVILLAVLTPILTILVKLFDKPGLNIVNLYSLISTV